MNDSENIVILCPDQLKIGDFVVVREADHDLIREIADAILSRSGYPGARKMAANGGKYCKSKHCSIQMKRFTSIFRPPDAPRDIRL